jgi:DNA invertase Pin-like site-specific DNA recombinase
MQSKMKVAIYVRVSTDEQNPKSQEDMCIRFCQRQGYNIYKIYTDVYTGTKDSRPSFNELLQDMREYKFNVIICTKLDRLGRSLQHLISLIDEFQKKKVDFICITQNIDTTSSVGKLQFHIMGAFAEFERNLISERTKEALRYKKNVGKRGKDKKPRCNKGYFGNNNLKRGGQKTQELDNKNTNQKDAPLFVDKKRGENNV